MDQNKQTGANPNVGPGSGPNATPQVGQTPYDPRNPLGLSEEWARRFASNEPGDDPTTDPTGGDLGRGPEPSLARAGLLPLMGSGTRRSRSTVSRRERVQDPHLTPRGTSNPQNRSCADPAKDGGRERYEGEGPHMEMGKQIIHKKTQ